jgi:hypothetical protein
MFHDDDFYNELPIIEHNGTKFRKWVRDERITHTGKCQCIKDCECFSEKGKKIGEIVTYFRRIEFDNTGKSFHTDINHLPIIK